VKEKRKQTSQEIDRGGILKQGEPDAIHSQYNVSTGPNQKQGEKDMKENKEEKHREKEGEKDKELEDHKNKRQLQSLSAKGKVEEEKRKKGKKAARRVRKCQRCSLERESVLFSNEQLTRGDDKTC
jgi:hypothetical protein